MIISLDAKKVFDKIQHLFIIKVLERSGIQGLYLHIINVIYSKSIANIKLNGMEIKAISLKPGAKHSCPFSLHLFNIIFEVLTTTINN